MHVSVLGLTLVGGTYAPLIRAREARLVPAVRSLLEHLLARYYYLPYYQVTYFIAQLGE